MSTTIDTAFVKQYEQEVKDAYQRQGAKLRGMVRTVNGVAGSSTTFQKIGSGTAGQKTRHGMIPVMNLDHTNVECTLSDWYAGEWVDKLDELKIKHDERGAIARAQAWAMGRKTDDLIITALVSGSNSTAITVLTEAAIRNSFLAAIEALQTRNAWTDGQMFGAVSPRVWAQLMTIEEFQKSEYVGEPLPYKASMGSSKNWLGVNWTFHTGLPLSTNTRTNIIWNRDACGHAIGADVSVEMQYYNTHAAHFFNAMMSQGAVAIDTDGIQEMTLDESSALPTS